MVNRRLWNEHHVYLDGIDAVDNFQSAAATVDSRLYYLRKCSYLLFRKSKTARLALSY